jgi:glycosyltransferase involved in cell wall biosynthesis
VLAVEPFYGGSHRAFLDGWIRNSRHTWTALTLPDRHWKWRMRHAAVTLAPEAMAAWEAGQRWDVLVCSDMLDLAQFQGLTRSRMADLPSLAYFHENQLTYPQQSPKERDLHFAFTNFVTALAADHVWFNSAFHQRDFLAGLNHWFARMPDYSPREAVESIRRKSRVQSPGVETSGPKPRRASGPLRIAWAARWEHDKNPETFFAAIHTLCNSGAEFRLSVFGQTFQEKPNVFLDAHETLSSHLDHWGYVDSHDDYLEKMSLADVFVSTADHGDQPRSTTAASSPPCLSRIAGPRPRCRYRGSAFPRRGLLL